MSGTGSREHQIFPVLTPAQVETAKRFASGAERRFEPGEMAYDVGGQNVPAWLVTAGWLEVFRHDGLSGETRITDHRPGQLSGEVNQLAGRPTLTGGRAGPEGCSAIPFDAAHVRALVVGSADVGEVIMRAFILRRVGLIEAGSGGSILVGEPGSPRLVRLQGFLTRSSYPHIVLDASTDQAGHALVERLGVLPADLPLMVCPSGSVLKNPSDKEAASCLGMVPELDPAKIYDVAVVGAGPAGLAASVYAASEGLSAIVIDERSAGGQAGASARIENYLGFPTGISGQALAGRAFNQALKFGTEIAIPLGVARLDCPEPSDTTPLKLTLSDGVTVQARTVVVASGARYRRPDIPNLATFEGAGVSYWASPIEAKLCAGEEIALVGGGNSAGQAVAFLAPYVKRLHLVVRRDGLAATMSRYLVERIQSLPNVELHPHSEVVSLEGDAVAGLVAATFRNRGTGQDKRCTLRHLFMFIGAEPNTEWLQGCVEMDDRGFVRTGRDIRDCAKPDQPLATSLPLVFAIGDVRAGSTKRVAAAVGEGAAVVAQIHAALAAKSSPSA